MENSVFVRPKELDILKRIDKHCVLNVEVDGDFIIVRANSQMVFYTWLHSTAKAAAYERLDLIVDALSQVRDYIESWVDIEGYNTE